MHRFIKAVGSGSTRARSLTEAEAREAMGLIADGRAQPVQVGALLLALRMKGESGDELAGFAAALDERSIGAGRGRAPAGTLDLDCHGDGHAGRSTLLPAAACAAAALGVPVVMRCDLGSPTARHGLRAALVALGVDTSRPLDAARAVAALEDGGPAVLDLAASSPALKELVDLRALLGVRTVAQTLMKLVNPLGARDRLLGVFHAPYLTPTAVALARLGAQRGVCVQAIGGLPEASAGKILRVAYASAPEAVTLDLRALPGARTAPPVADKSHDASDEAVRDNRAALAGEEPAALAAAAACALLLHAARGDEPLAAAALALEALRSGRAREAAARLGAR